MNSILDSPLSPTQQKSKQFKTKTINSVIIDDNFKECPIEVTYDYTPYYGLGWEVSVWGYDYKADKMQIGEKDLSNEIKDIIRIEENCHVTFY
jgi:hypothetical protein